MGFAVGEHKEKNMNKECEVLKDYNGFKKGQKVVLEGKHARGMAKVGNIKLIGSTRHPVTPYPSTHIETKIEKKVLKEKLD
jgi:hypothetical protein